MPVDCCSCAGELLAALELPNRLLPNPPLAGLAPKTFPPIADIAPPPSMPPPIPVTAVFEGPLLFLL